MIYYWLVRVLALVMNVDKIGSMDRDRVRRSTYTPVTLCQMSRLGLGGKVDVCVCFIQRIVEFVDRYTHVSNRVWPLGSKF
jgi:hypothetical protein